MIAYKVVMQNDISVDRDQVIVPGLSNRFVADMRQPESFVGLPNMSPRPINWLAPGVSRMVRESTIAITRKATRAGKFALITPVMMFVDGRCVAITM